MKTVAVFFASSRYWKDESVLQRAYSELAGGMPQGVECALVKDTAGPNALPEGSCLIAVPMSGAVQRAVLAAAGRYEQVALYGAYIRGNAPDVWCDEMLRCNAAPTLMDSWAVLRRRGPGVRLALNAAGLADTLKLWEAYYSVKDATLLMIGKTEQAHRLRGAGRKNLYALLQGVYRDQKDPARQFPRVKKPGRAGWWGSLCAQGGPHRAFWPAAKA